MRQFTAKLRNRFTIPAISSIIVGVGMSIVFSFLPNTDWITATQAGYLVYAGIGLVILGVGLGLWGIIKTPVPDNIKLYGIIPILNKAVSRLWNLAYKEAKKPIDWKSYDNVNKKINTDILHVKVTRSNKLKTVQMNMAKVEMELRQKHGAVSSIEEFLEKLRPLSAYLDSCGFGMKFHRERDAKYLKLNRKIDQYRDIPMDEKLNLLIKEHIEFSEYSSNMLLAKIRALQPKTKDNVAVLNIISTQSRIECELAEKGMKEMGYYIRAQISDHLRELEKMRGGKK